MGCSPFLNRIQAELLQQSIQAKKLKAKKDLLGNICKELGQMEEDIQEIQNVSEAEQAKNRLTYLWTLFLDTVPNLEAS